MRCCPPPSPFSSGHPAVALHGCYMPGLGAHVQGSSQMPVYLSRDERGIGLTLDVIQFPDGNERWCRNG